MKNWLSYLIPQKIAEFQTPFNAYIRINYESGKMKLLVNGSPQSGPYINTLWSAALGAFGIPVRKDVKTILVLGTAGGTVIWKLHTLFPKALITGVEIDATMIDIGKKYFSLAEIKQLKLIKADAKVFVQNEVKNKHTYDLVVVDMSFGRVIPDFVTTPTFIHQIKQLIHPTGVVVINYLRELEYQSLSDAFKNRLQKEFLTVREHGIYRNRFFFGSIV
jgi:spermidine synthase